MLKFAVSWLAPRSVTRAAFLTAAFLTALFWTALFWTAARWTSTQAASFEACGALRGRRLPGGSLRERRSSRDKSANKTRGSIG